MHKNALSLADDINEMPAPAVIKDIENEILFFNNIAEKWDSIEVKSLPEKVRYILAKCGLKKGDDVLDLGTGTGVLLPFICEICGTNATLRAVDFSWKMLEVAQRKFATSFPHIEFIQADIENDAIPGKYNQIMLYCVYPHLRFPEHTLNKLLQNNLEKDGSIWIAFPSDADFINSIHAEKKSEADKLPTATELTARLSAAGFTSEVIEDTSDAYIVRITADIPSVD